MVHHFGKVLNAFLYLSRVVSSTISNLSPSQKEGKKISNLALSAEYPGIHTNKPYC